MKTIRFFALGGDILSLIQIIESSRALRFCPYGNYLESEYDLINKDITSARLIPDLGKASGSQPSTCNAYVVCPKESEIYVERFISSSGEKRVAVDQRRNPHSVVLRPCGLWSENIIIGGNIGTVSTAPESLQIMKLFEKAIKKEFRKVKAFYVGPLAYKMLENGKRLACASVTSPPELDLKL